MSAVSTALLFIIAMAATHHSIAQSRSTRPVRLVTPFTVDSGVDIVARTVARKLSADWAQPVVVENIPGAAGIVGTAVVARSYADGYTLLVTSSAHTVNPVMYKSLPYDTFKDFVEVAPLARFAQVLVVAPAAGVRSVSDLIAVAKDKPGQLNFASPGMGSGVHFTGEKFRLAAGINVIHSPCKGGADVVLGRVTYWIPPIGAALPYIQSGKLLPLAVTTQERSELLPQVATMAEAGVAGFDDSLWFGMWAPAATPGDIVSKLAKDAAHAVQSPHVRHELARMSAEPMTMTQAQFSQFARNEAAVAARIAEI
ncbi:MAG TPA: tripartite tricarboxylate transporter substrate-binding protein, partial [Burkholderiales bacterium]|nr:tripartite tricarboxylate transporter substrate-binding protein [Burkholderiales bacterium]